MKVIDLTILLVIKDRQFFTMRWLSYMNHICYPYSIYIADGGSDMLLEEKIKKKNFNNISIKYRHFGYDNNHQLYLKKINDSLLEIKTKYVLLADDDDFFLTKGIEDSVLFLESNEDYSSCGGRQAGIFNYSEGIYLEGKYNLRLSSYPHEGIEHQDGLDRITHHLANYSATYYDVHRTKEMKEIFKEVNEAGFSDLYLVELFVQTIILINGKNKKLKNIYLIRQHNNPLSSSNFSSPSLTFFIILL